MIIGLDVGGTNIDIVLIKNKKLVKYLKYPLNNLNKDIISGLNQIIKDEDLKKVNQVNLSTTLSTNLIMTNNLEEVLTIIQNGLGLPNSYYKINNNSFFISGYTDHRGQVLNNYDNNEIKKIKEYIIKNNIKNVAINTKFSVKNDEVERKLKEELKDLGLKITLGSNLTANLNLKRRINTSYLNSGILNKY